MEKNERSFENELTIRLADALRGISALTEAKEVFSHRADMAKESEEASKALLADIAEALFGPDLKGSPLFLRRLHDSSSARRFNLDDPRDSFIEACLVMQGTRMDSSLAKDLIEWQDFLKNLKKRVDIISGQKSS